MMNVIRTYGGKYYFITTDPRGTKLRIEEAYDYVHDVDNARCKAGNYFLTMTAAEMAAERIKDAMKGEVRCRISISQKEVDNEVLQSKTERV